VGVPKTSSLRITSGHSFDHLVGAGGQFGADNFDFASYDIERCCSPTCMGYGPEADMCGARSPALAQTKPRREAGVQLKKGL
jgi:hypothetical protein